MRIQCPYCGERDVSEFAYLGDAHVERPDPGGAEASRRFYESVYLRDNPAGPHIELWYHTAGCRSWLRVARDTLTHELLGVELARQQPGAAPAGGAGEGEVV
ncbi:MAG TPA: sarcosine oxidase subunit delta [Steroidobacteraceae bacterium]|nr:sarcosine oxidase subunit delta [Steroidobacteraceae bacterium]